LLVHVSPKSICEAKLGGFVMPAIASARKFSGGFDRARDRMERVLSILSSSERPQMDTDETQIGLPRAAMDQSRQDRIDERGLVAAKKGE